ncbi:MAG: TlpA disulfide reductase family protein [Kiloniellales bacterium]|nr:TlpA disulfide reductase family protein [Kiloniellales bacterium]
MTKNTLPAGLALALVLSAAILLTAGFERIRAEETPPLEGLLADNFILLEQPAPAPQDAVVTDAFGGEVGLADFRGRVVLVNFWATWCAPCVREMPSLDRLQAKLGPEGLLVMAVSQDRKGLAAAEPFYRERGLDNLEIFLDPKGDFARAMGVGGLPTSMLIDDRGRVLGGIEGPLEWDGPEAVELIRFYLVRRENAGLPGATDEG